MKTLLVVVVILVACAGVLAYNRSRQVMAEKPLASPTRGAPNQEVHPKPGPPSPIPTTTAPRSALQRILDNDLPAPKSPAVAGRPDETVPPNLRRILETHASNP